MGSLREGLQPGGGLRRVQREELGLGAGAVVSVPVFGDGLQPQDDDGWGIVAVQVRLGLEAGLTYGEGLVSIVGYKYTKYSSLVL